MNEQENADLESQPKVTIGFKAPVWLKAKLAEKSAALGITISEFCEMNFLKDLNSDNNADSSNVDFLKSQITLLEKNLEFYESSKLRDFFKKLQGKEIKFSDPDGNEIDLTVTTLRDAFVVLIHSFQIGDNL
jgi:hypothetical protein